MSLPVPPLRGHRDDDTLDAIALVEAVLRDDLEGAGAVLRNMDAGPVAVVLAKLCGELAGELGAYPQCWRRWALDAVRRP